MAVLQSEQSCDGPFVVLAANLFFRSRLRFLNDPKGVESVFLKRPSMVQKSDINFKKLRDKLRVMSLVTYHWNSEHAMIKNYYFRRA